MTASGHPDTLPLRMRTIHGHVRAVERLVRDGRTREAVMQLRAVRAALSEVVMEICRAHLEHAKTRAEARRAVISLTPLLHRRK